LSEAGLNAWGEDIGVSVSRPLVLALHGELGAGKSVLARAVARGAGVTGHMPSPTFNLVFRYETPGGPVLHLDLYRLANAAEVWELGWRELGEDGDVVLIEWPERAAALLPADRWDIHLQAVPGEPLLRDVRGEAKGSPSALPSPGRI
jgi:tRNA threonylcarbamoyl adenosine modification protein YjeE